MSLKHVSPSFLLFVLTLALLPFWTLAQAQAQNPPSDQTQQAPTEHPKHHGMKGSHVTVTGCLQKGDEANEYAITGEDGKKYGLRSTTVKLGDHVGHKVTVTGRVKKEAEKNEPSGESADLTVTKLQMVSESCQ
jgi:hypothetical protein